jgi:hypothetical protein
MPLIVAPILLSTQNIKMDSILFLAVHVVNIPNIRLSDQMSCVTNRTGR